MGIGKLLVLKKLHYTITFVGLFTWLCVYCSGTAERDRFASVRMGIWRLRFLKVGTKEKVPHM